MVEVGLPSASTVNLEGQTFEPSMMPSKPCVLNAGTKADTAEELAEAIETMETKDRKEKGGVSQCDSDTKFESII